MSDKEKHAFRLVFDWYKKWREVIITTDEQWNEFADSVGNLARDLDVDHSPLGSHLMMAVIDTINDLYKDGKQPVVCNYFGREDL